MPSSYEREADAASLPAPRGYRRREPKKTALRAVVRKHFETLLDEGRRPSDAGTGYPRFIEHELHHYLDCSLLARGFARLHCPLRGFERQATFSCKGRLCPSYWARRTAGIAARLVDRVLARGLYRQWVLTFPWPLRFLLAMAGEILSDMLQAFLRTLFAWQRLLGRRFGVADGQIVSVTFLQRFGGLLTLKPHAHCRLQDRLFVPGATPGSSSIPPARPSLSPATPLPSLRGPTHPPAGSISGRQPSLLGCAHPTRD